MSEVRYELGFVGGGAAAGTAAESEWKALEAAFAAGTDTVVPLTGDGAVVHVRTSQLAWARTLTRDPKVGF